MADTTSPQLPTWQRVIGSQRFMSILSGMLTASGFFGLKVVKAYFPDLNVSELSGDIVVAVPWLANEGIQWYRNHPDNILARARKVIEGGTASPQAVAAVATTAEKAA